MKELISIADKSKIIPKTKKSQNTPVKPWSDPSLTTSIDEQDPICTRTVVNNINR
jgi:hypothetical protein